MMLWRNLQTSKSKTWIYQTNADGLTLHLRKSIFEYQGKRDNLSTVYDSSNGLSIQGPWSIISKIWHSGLKLSTIVQSSDNKPYNMPTFYEKLSLLPMMYSANDEARRKIHLKICYILHPSTLQYKFQTSKTIGLQTAVPQIPWFLYSLIGEYMKKYVTASVIWWKYPHFTSICSQW